MNLFLIAAALSLGACAEVQLASHVAKKVPPASKTQGTFKVGNPYQIDGRWYQPQESYTHQETGIASWYGAKFHGRRTANGEIFDKNELTAAHRTLQMPSLIRVTNLENGRSIILRVNDRGPFAKNRVLDVSQRAAELLGFKNQGTARVKVQVLKQESLEIAEAARQGQNTAGVEVAMNRRKYGSPTGATSQPPATAPVHDEPAVQVAALQPVEIGDIVPPPGVTGHSRDGRFYPDPVLKQFPVTPTTIYVQAGSFTNKDNADRLAQNLSSLGEVRVMQAVVNGQQFYRVRMPAPSVPAADQLMREVVRAGNANTIIVVD
ncbi:MAG: septal ring lytic transglycosylase RlpA family protein [Alphaproteobacteria bacterium]